MAKSQDEQIAAFRNFFLLSVIAICILIACLYVSGVIFAYLIYGKVGLFKIFTLRPENQILYFLDLFIKSWNIIAIDFKSIGLTGSNYFTVKLILSQ